MKNSGIEWIGEIPDSWKLVNIGNVLKEHKQENKMLDTRALQFKYGTIVPKKELNLTQDALDILTKYNVVSPNIIMVNGLNLAFDFVTQRVALVKENGVITSTYIALAPQELIVPEYATYTLKAFDSQKVFHSLGRGLRCMLSYDVIKREKMPLPSLAVQRSIVNCLVQKLGEVDKLIEVQQAQIDKLKEYKQSVITEAVTKGLDPTVPMKDVSSWMRRIPCNWFDPKIKYFCSIESGGTPERTHPEYWNGDINWFKTGELHNDEIFDSEEKITVKAIEETAAKIFPRNAILVAMYGQGKTRGMTALLKKESATNQACAAIQLKTKIYEVNYLWWVLKGAYNSLRERANGSGQPNLSVSLINEFEISLPPLLEQQKIICYLDDKCAKIDKLIAIKQAKIDKLQEYKKSLIYEYVTGKKEVV